MACAYASVERLPSSGAIRRVRGRSSWWHCDAAVFEELSLRGSQASGLPKASGRAGQGDLVDAAQFAVDGGPGLAGAAFGDPELLPGIGHTPILEEPPRTAALILAFAAHHAARAR